MAIQTLPGQIDVMLLYNSVDRPEVEQIYQELRRRGLRPWMDCHDIRPGEGFQEAFAHATQLAKAAAAVYSKNGAGKWQRKEIPAVFKSFIDTQRRVIPIWLDGAKDISVIWIGDIMIADHSPVKFERGVGDPHAYDLLEWAITGRDPRAGRGQFQIQVSVPQAEQTCFIAVPPTGSDELYQLIREAAKEVGIECAEPCAPSKMATPQQLTEAICSAKMVVAVCDSISPSKESDPSCMFLLGYATSLGKPVLCITRKGTILPAVVPDTIRTLEYAEHELTDRSLKMKLVAEIQTTIHSLRHPFLVEPNRPGVSVAYADMLRIPIAAWDKFEVIISFGLAVQSDFRAIANQVHKLYRAMEECYESATGLIVESAVCNWNWRVCQRAYANLVENNLPTRNKFLAPDNNPSDLQVRLDFDYLASHTTGPLKEACTDARKNYELVLKSIGWYYKHLDDVHQKMKKTNAQEEVPDIWPLVAAVHSDMQVVQNFTHAMLAAVLRFFGKAK